MATPSIYVISAMCGNFWTESGVNPGIWESLSVGTWTSLNKGYGLGQWTNTGGDTQGRLYKLHEYLSSNGYADDSMEGQLKYIEVEGTWHKGTTYQKEISYTTLNEFLTSDSTDLNELTKAWLYCWEGLNNGTLSQRQTQAQEVYNYIVANIDTVPTDYYHSNSYLSNEQRLHNALYIYHVLNGGEIPEPEPEPTKKRSMPVWMMIRYRV